MLAHEEGLRDDLGLLFHVHALLEGEGRELLIDLGEDAGDRAPVGLPPCLIEVPGVATVEFVHSLAPVGPRAGAGVPSEHRERVGHGRAMLFEMAQMRLPDGEGGRGGGHDFTGTCSVEARSQST